jgi:hypothetical protein
MSSWPPPGYVPPSAAPGPNSPVDNSAPLKYPPGPEGAFYPPADGWAGGRDRDVDRDREGWVRDREWNEYERRRTEWEYRRGQGRTRSRSPGMDDGKQPGAILIQC